MIGIYMLAFVVLVAGGGAMGTAIAYVVRPTEGKLTVIRPFSLAGVFAGLCGSAAGFAVALERAARVGVNTESLKVMLMGFTEALVPLFVAFGFLSVTWLLVALGIRRQV